MSKAKWHLTRDAARALRSIYVRSTKQWGQPRADDYMAEIYAIMNKFDCDLQMDYWRNSRVELRAQDQCRRCRDRLSRMAQFDQRNIERVGFAFCVYAGLIPNCETLK
jgi:hypothetical protein